jgi:hypothetical protein
MWGRRPGRLPGDIARSLVDPFGRAISYLRCLGDGSLRISALRLLHVRGHELLPKKDLLTLEELDRSASGFAVCQVRILGQPWCRRTS